MPRASDPNRCRAHEIEPLAVRRPRRGVQQPAAPPPQAAPPKQRKRKASQQPPDDDADEDAGEEQRLYTYEEKLDIFQRCIEWIEKGKKRADSPIADLVEQYGCAQRYPNELFKKVKRTGSIDNRWNPAGRPGEFSEECFEKGMVGIIRKAREKQKVASGAAINAEMKKTRGQKGKRVGVERLGRCSVFFDGRTHGRCVSAAVTHGRCVSAAVKVR